MRAVFLDTETNGLNPQTHHIVELAFKIIDLETEALLTSYEKMIFLPEDLWAKSDPASLKINGFSWKEIEEKGETPELIREEIIQCFEQFEIKRKKAVFICQNPSFDRIFFSKLIDADRQEALFWPYHWLDLASMYWALSLNQARQNKGPPPWTTGFSKDSIASHYQLAPEEKPHRAMNGVSHLLLCYSAMLGSQVLIKPK
ncbi:MAG: 3'-5' exonuclease [Chlamydiia bacterium]|nr:3'-5' exonuclease [Chlamydiia bacterium]